MTIPLSSHQPLSDQAAPKTAGIIAAPGQDLGHRHRQVPRSHPDRGPLPRPRAPVRPRPPPGVHSAGPQGEWLAARLEDLDYGYIDGITAAARHYPLTGVKKDELDTALGYFENNAPRMRYHWFRLFVGSGVVEASCKSVIGQRLKQAGMHWTVNGADAIIALRCQEASRTWEAICGTPHTRTRTA